jgi:hypothetical protein
MRRRFLKGVNVRVEERVAELRWRWKASGRESVGYIGIGIGSSLMRDWGKGRNT